ncbi:MAG: glutathione S-transferase domain-containing protein, partial [Gammaproteobacteria bacterium]|nr:glutathione S-transferase domain-containing protein [Gammaproteobacteria bacterium]
REHLPITLMKLMKDRAKMGRASKVKMPNVEESKKVYQQMLSDLNQQLSDEFLFGGLPSIADFSVYHLVWFNVYLGNQAIPAEFEKLDAWYQRMTEFGHGNTTRKSMRYALGQARENQPRQIASEDIVQGKQKVSISPDDYRLDPVEGELVGESKQRWIIAREIPKGGVVHVHFPKEGFSIS